MVGMSRAAASCRNRVQTVDGPGRHCGSGRRAQGTALRCDPSAHSDGDADAARSFARVRLGRQRPPSCSLWSPSRRGRSTTRPSTSWPVAAFALGGLVVLAAGTAWLAGVLLVVAAATRYAATAGIADDVAFLHRACLVHALVVVTAAASVSSDGAVRRVARRALADRRNRVRGCARSRSRPVRRRGRSPSGWERSS